MDETDVKPWERQPGESSKAFEAFKVYRDAGRARTFLSVAKRLQKSNTLILRWSAKWRWADRAAAYDNDLERHAHERTRELAAEIRERHLRIAFALERKALEALNRLPAQKISARDAKEILRLATDVEHRLAIEPEEREKIQKTAGTSADITITLIDPATGEKTNVR